MDRNRKNKGLNFFEIGKKIQIGFMHLTCVEPREKGKWILVSDKGIYYFYVPHQGVTYMGYSKEF